MATNKIKKPQGETPSDLELRVASELYNLEEQGDLKEELKGLYIAAAKQIQTRSGKNVIILYVPYRLLQSFHKFQTRLVRELEKKFAESHVVIIAQRTILGQGYLRDQKTRGPRPRSRTLTHVREAMLSDLVYPFEIVGKRTRVTKNGSVQKIFLNSDDKVTAAPKLETFGAVFQKLTNHKAVFDFPPS